MGILEYIFGKFLKFWKTMLCMFQYFIHSRSKRFFVYCFAFLVGVCFISILDKQIDFLYLYISFFVVLFLLIIFWGDSQKRFFIFIFLFFILGIVRYIIPLIFTSEHVSNFNGTKMELRGYVVTEPDVRMDGVRYIVNSQYAKGNGMELHGRVYIKSGLYPRYSYGDVVDIDCDLKSPKPVEDFAYDKYLARYGIFSICETSKIKKIRTGEGNVLFRSVLSIKEVVADRINRLWHEPYASFMAGLLYGYRGGLGHLNDLFSRTGVTHIVAISGYNITLIATLLITFFINIYIPRKRSFWFVVAGIVIFTIFAGLSASVVRAGIMGIIVLMAKQVGSMSRIGNVLMLTAVIMTLQNPFVLMYDAGFQLSFLSTMGLVYLSPHVGKLFTRVSEKVGMRDSIVSTISATIITLPLIMYQFGRLSIVSLPVNMLILWIIPFIMIFGFFAVIFSFLFQPFGLILSWIAWLGMFYIVQVVEWFASLKFSAVDIKVSVFVMIAMYVGLLYFLSKNNKKTI